MTPKMKEKVSFSYRHLAPEAKSVRTTASAYRTVKRNAAWLAIAALGACSSASAQTTTTYYYVDHLGSVLATADGAGGIITTADYRPFGGRALGSEEHGPGFTGHVGDEETGLVYMQARYYDPSVGRFTSLDPVRPSAGNIFDINRFAYVNNNPILLSDPTGRCPQCWPVAEAGAALLAAAGAGYATYLIVDQVSRQQPGTAPVAMNETQTSGEAKDKLYEGTEPAAGASGRKGEREGAAGGEQVAWDKISGKEEQKDGAKIKRLPDGSVVDLHGSTKSSYPQGTPSIKVRDPSGKVIGTVRYPRPTPTPTPTDTKTPND